jgi:uncharacterized protein YecT (DUF1311 family)
MSSMNICAEYEFILSDLELNDAYKSALANYVPSTAKLLVRSQRAWLSYRDKSCAFESSGLEGGSAHAFSTNICLRQLTLTRTKELQEYNSCTGGGCPGPRK